MSIDQRLRNGLHPSGSDPGPDTLAALRRVEQRAERRARTARLTTGALVAAVLLLVVGFGVTLQREGRSDRDPVVATVPVEQRLLGTYVVDVGDSRVGRQEGITGRWIVTFEEGGSLELRPPEGYSGATTGVAYRLQGDQLRTDALVEPGCQADGGYVGTYTWALTGDALTFTLVEDTCTARRILFTAQAWDRVP